MAFDGNIFRQVDVTYGDTHVDAALRDPRAQTYLETHQNLHSGEPDVVESDLRESLDSQRQEIEQSNPILFEQIRAHLAITDALRQETQGKEVA